MPPYPVTIARSNGASLIDVDGNTYIDFLGNFTAGLYGHREASIEDGIRDALKRGISLGGHSVLECNLARLICQRFPSIAKIRFTSSGTEANLWALSVAKQFTSKKKVLAFRGGFHGSLLNFSENSCPTNCCFEFVLSDFNDSEHLYELFERHGRELGAVIVEPMLGAGGCIPATREFLLDLRANCDKYGACLIFDEVMTSRLNWGGLQAQFGVTPDLTTLGKYLGGGNSFGAFGGSEHFMAAFDPSQSNCLVHSGTYNNDELTMAAGVAAAGILTRDVISNLNELGDRLRRRLNQIAAENSTGVYFSGIGSMLFLHFGSGPALRSQQGATDRRLRLLIHLDLLREGIWIGANGFLSLSLAIRDRDCERLIASFSRVLKSRERLLAV